jgi:hypothetical protein
MAEQVVFERISPVVPVLDLDVAMDRYRRLGFDVSWPGGTRCAFVRRGSVTLHLTEWHEHDPGRTAAHLYIYVSDADSLHAVWAAAGVEGRLKDPFDTQYGLSQFAYVDPDGTLHQVGSPLSNPTA